MMYSTGSMRRVLTLLGMLFLVSHSSAFVQPKIPVTTRMSGSRARSFVPQMSTIGEFETLERVDVVLFGVGDLRTHDHSGLTLALKRATTSNSRVLPLVILDTEDTLARLPGAVGHTLDTAAMLSKSLESLKENLGDIGLTLHFQVGHNGVCDALGGLFDHVKAEAQQSTEMHVHLCDLGDVDNNLGYGPWSHCRDGLSNSNISLHPWSCQLRLEPWESGTVIPDSYPEYTKLFTSQPIEPFPKPKLPADGIGLRLESLTSMPSSEDIASLLQNSLKLDRDQCKFEENTGLFGTHWGGLKPETVGETNVLKLIDSFVKDCKEEDENWVIHPDYSGRSCKQNPASLEHSAISWMMKGDGSTPAPNTNNLIAGETMTRFLAAPLLLGTVSPRRLWHTASKDSILHTSVLKTIPETREWHKILAARNLRTDPQFSDRDGTGLRYGYWRWNGFLCRYARSTLKPEGISKGKEGVLLVHGFGASSSQWSKALHELSQSVAADETTETSIEGLAPCLIGFGQSEKPPLTYTQYLWDSYVSSFVKEIAINRHGWDQFVVGGNSIGGFTAMGCGADDTVTATASSFVSGSGAPGTGRCTGVVLMNSAGQIKTREMLEKEQQSVDKDSLMSIAEKTASGALPDCKPLPRPAARLFGNGLLAYLRPRIQSICSNLYPTNEEAVDDALCDGILRDSLDPGAINVMISGSKLPPPRTVNELLGANYGSAESNGNTAREGIWKGPVLVAQGLLDPLNDAKGRASMLGDLRDGITVSPIDAGHCPHDELPRDVAVSIAQWLKVSRPERLKSSSAATAAEVQSLS